MRALLAYLAVEAGRAHSRRILASLLWPDCADAVAADRFRNALSNLRRVLGDRDADPPFILSSRETVQLNPDANVWVDVAALSEAVSAARAGQADAAALRQALGWVRGPFLQGMSIRNSPSFEEWLLLLQERINRQVMDGFGWLAAECERQGKYGEAGDWVQRQLELEPLAENVHRDLIRLLALSGRRAAALDQYEACRSLLAEELDVEPADETKALRERIRRGELGRGSTITPARVPPAPAAESFVSRETELAKLDGFLDLALAGHGRVGLVIGEAGSGKSALLRQFARRAMDRRSDVIAAYGTCTTYSGMGDPYLPFREILQMLTASPVSGPAGFAASPNLARRLWALLPEILPILIEHGPDLIGRFIPADELVLRSEASAPYQTTWWPRLRELVKRRDDSAISAREGDGIGLAAQPQQAIFEQMSRVLQKISEHHPLVLILDDLQWVDAGSASLLFHLGRRLAGSRILIVGAYRPEDVDAENRKGFRHLLHPVANELQREFGDIRVDLDRTETRMFVDALLDSQPNRLGPSFRNRLHRITGGHALFTVELLREMRENGDLVPDEAGRWVEGPSLSWKRLPPRVEAIIAERTDSLPAELRAMLGVAAVEGEEFTAEVVAAVCGRDEKDTIRTLSGPLGRVRGLVHPSRVENHPTITSGGLTSRGSGSDPLADAGRRLSRYRFHHALFQKYLYDHLDLSERTVLHEAVGHALEGLAGGDEDVLTALSPALAWHFEKAGLYGKAVHYLDVAGRRADALSAFEESLALATHGLDLLATLPESPARNRQELDMRVTLILSLSSRRWGSAEQLHMMERVHELCERVAEMERRLDVLYLLCNIHQGRAELREMVRLAGQMLDVAERAGNHVYVTLAHAYMGLGCLQLCDLAAVGDHAERAMAWYRSALAQASPGHRTDVAESMLVCVQIANKVASWLRGHADPDGQRLRQAGEIIAKSNYQPGLAIALSFELIFRYVHGERLNSLWLSEVARALASETGLPVVHLWIQVLEDLREIDHSEPRAAIARTRQAMSRWQTQGAAAGLPLLHILLADACLRTGQVGDGLDALDAVSAILEGGSNHLWDSEILRLRGELLLACDRDVAEAEALFRAAIAVAQRQQAKAWELRASLSLARLFQRRSRRDEARQMLAAVCGGFDETFDSPDLEDARRMLTEL